MTKVTPFLMFNDQLEAAIAFYTATFPDSEIKNVARTGADGPITSAVFVIGGQSFMGYNGGEYFKFSEGFSLFVDCEDQEEVEAADQHADQQGHHETRQDHGIGRVHDLGRDGSCERDGGRDRQVDIAGAQRDHEHLAERHDHREGGEGEGGGQHLPRAHPAGHDRGPARERHVASSAFPRAPCIASPAAGRPD